MLMEKLGRSLPIIRPRILFRIATRAAEEPGTVVSITEQYTDDDQDVSVYGLLVNTTILLADRSIFCGLLLGRLLGL
jgi:hypothetical protein